MEFILSIESSCDETAVALVDEAGRVAVERIASQIETHRRYGGVVPEVASRDHFATLDALVASVLADPAASGVRISRVAATCGPGLVGPLLVGSSYAQGLAVGWGCPFVGVHHLRGHVASVLLAPTEANPAALRERARDLFPAFVLLVSGGHSQVLEVQPDLRARRLADTADDAAGECFDKAAKLMGLPYPGGPALERLAATAGEAQVQAGRRLAKELPRPRSSEGFSFSGLKTAIRLKLAANPAFASDPAFAYAVQESIGETLVGGLARALRDVETRGRSLVFCGGVSANRRVRALLEAKCRDLGLSLVVPSLRYCTDNAAMIGAAAWIQAPEVAVDSIEARIPLDLAPPPS